jgi:hypothetical protein
LFQDRRTIGARNAAAGDPKHIGAQKQAARQRH